MLPCFASSLAGLALVSCFALVQQPAVTSVNQAVHGINPAFVDRKVNPTTDFFRFSNGVWLDQAQIGRDQPSISATGQTRQRNEEMLWRIATAAAIDHDTVKGSPDQQVGDFLLTGLNQEQADRLGFQPIDGELRRIAAIQTRGDVLAELARLQRWWISACFHTEVGHDYQDSSHKILTLSQGSFSLRSRSPYFNDDAPSKNLRARLKDSVQKMLVLLGDAPDDAQVSAQSVLSIETALARASIPEADTGGIEANYHSVKIADLRLLAPEIEWSRYFHELGAEGAERLDIAQPAYFKAFGAMMGSVSVRDWRLFLKWRLVSAAAPYLSSDFAQASFNLESALTGQQTELSRPELTLQALDSCLGSELGELMARVEFGLNAKPKVLEIVRNVRAALRDTIQGLDWMAPDTKARAIEKLDKLQVDVCYPQHRRDSSALLICSDSFAQNVFRAREFEFSRQLEALAKPIDRGEWRVRSYAVDARYDQSLNAIILPAGVLQPPYFDAQADDASNYGAIGAVIGHEMTHAFDGRGRKFDADGNLKNWWSNDDGTRYDEHQQAIVAQYDDYQVQPHLKVNGKLTLEENVADLGGVTVAFKAFKRLTAGRAPKKLDGFTPDQRFFLAFGQLFRSKMRPEVERLGIENDPHSPPKYRVNGVLQNVPEFWTAFGAEPPKTHLRIW